MVLLKSPKFFSPPVRRWLIIAGFLAALLSFPAYAGVSLAYTETKGPFKN